jgi:hypothetical protein
MVEIDIRDTGAGIPAEALPHVFERFLPRRSCPRARLRAQWGNRAGASHRQGTDRSAGRRHQGDERGRRRNHCNRSSPRHAEHSAAHSSTWNASEGGSRRVRLKVSLATDRALIETCFRPPQATGLVARGGQACVASVDDPARSSDFTAIRQNRPLWTSRPCARRTSTHSGSLPLRSGNWGVCWACAAGCRTPR